MNYTIDFSDADDPKPGFKKFNPLWNFKVNWSSDYTKGMKRVLEKKQKLEKTGKILNRLSSVGLIEFNEKKREEIKLSNLSIKAFLRYLELQEEAHPELPLDKKIEVSIYLTVINSFVAYGFDMDLTKEKLTKYVQVLDSIIRNCLK